MPQVLTYPVELTPAEEGGFIVTFPGLPIVTEGDTEEEALFNAKEAFLCHLEGEAKVREREGPSSGHIVILEVETPDKLVA